MRIFVLFSLLPTPYSLLPVPCSLFPVPCSLWYMYQFGITKPADTLKLQLVQI
ncbi:MAG: hypothetical protein F6J90_32930 [Moorea sp. SIOASIH]|uniref:hypothetical protein n=1 Tax=Moorena sp. SIOASIH TaxID=2607817 RepID=UPI0013B8D780|nr:hypothetical protein [Moorena sp. SIOASIH]NEO40881.1 hypothetical protein [Moorena sp. SIOASIH]